MLIFISYQTWFGSPKYRVQRSKRKLFFTQVWLRTAEDLLILFFYLNNMEQDKDINEKTCSEDLVVTKYKSAGEIVNSKMKLL